MFLKGLMVLGMLLLVCGGWQCNTSLVEELVPPADEVSQGRMDGVVPLTVLDGILNAGVQPGDGLAVTQQKRQEALERLYLERGVLQSPIPDDVYSLLWGDWEARGDDAPRRYYTKYMDADGIAIVGSDKVEDMCFHAARGVVRVMLSRLPGVREALSIHTPGVVRPEVRFRLILRHWLEKVWDFPDIHPVSNENGDFLDHADTVDVHYATSALQVSVVKTPHQIAEENGWDPLPPDVVYPAIIDELAGNEYVAVGVVVHEFAHIVDGVFRWRPELFPYFEARLWDAYRLQMERVRLGVSEGPVEVRMRMGRRSVSSGTRNRVGTAIKMSLNSGR